MDIPVEVISKALDATESLDAEYTEDLTDAMQAAAPIIAEWARREALNEAADTAENYIYEYRRADYGDTFVEGIAVRTAAAIRALVEGEPK